MPGQVIYKHGWRKCSEEMPPDGKRVLASPVDSPENVGILTMRIHTHLSAASWRSWTDDGGNEFWPTHWQPIPPAPTEGE